MKNMIIGVIITMELGIFVFKRLFSDIALTYKQMCKRSSIIFFVLIFLAYSIWPMADLSDKQYFFSDIINTVTLKSCIISIGLLFIVSVVHFSYLLNITNYFQRTSTKEFFLLNKGRLIKALTFTFIGFGLNFIIFKVFDYNEMKVSNLWLFIFINQLRLFIIYAVISFGTLVLTDRKSINVVISQFTLKRIIIKLIKAIILIIIVDLLLSPVFYCIVANSFYVDQFSSKKSLLTWAYYFLECLINTSIIIFFYNFVELLVHDRNRKMIHRKTFKKVILISLSFLYMYIWFTCGVIFQADARESNGRDFIFQEDIKVKLEAKALKDLTNINVDDYVVCDLIKNSDLQKESINFEKDSNGFTEFTSSDNSSSNLDVVKKFNFTDDEGTLCTSEIGKYWGEFYCSDFYHKGVSYYNFEIENSIDTPSGIGINSSKLYPLTISLYKTKDRTMNLEGPQPNNIRLLSSSEDINNYELVTRCTILIKDSAFATRLERDKENSNEDSNPEYSNLINILEHSINFISYDYKKINNTFNRIETTGIRYPLIDFLYYSAVTITTTGYGDILPNSTSIRTIVMFETFFGVAIPGLFVSLLFFKVGYKEKNNIES